MTYNELESIDQVIEKFEQENIELFSGNSKGNKLLEERKQKIEKLKQLKREAKIREAKNIEKLINDNIKLDMLINNFEKVKLNSQNTDNSNTNNYPSYFFGDESSESRESRENIPVKTKTFYDPFGFGDESRDSGESRW